MKNYIITIARGYGSGGSHIAKRLSEELNIPYYDSEILKKAAELSGINEAYFFEANEKINKGQIAVKNSKGVYTGRLYSPDDKKFLSNENLFNYQAEVIKTLALEGKESCIIVGKAANYILRSLKNVVKINIQAPIEHCVANVSRRLELNTVDARKLIEKTDAYRSNYYKYYTGNSWNDPTEYDMTINTGALGEAYAVELIEKIVKDKGLID